MARVTNLDKAETWQRIAEANLATFKLSPDYGTAIAYREEETRLLLAMEQTRTVLNETSYAVGRRLGIYPKDERGYTPEFLGEVRRLFDGLDSQDKIGQRDSSPFWDVVVRIARPLIDRDPAYVQARVLSDEAEKAREAHWVMKCPEEQNLRHLERETERAEAEVAVEREKRERSLVRKEDKALEAADPDLQVVRARVTKARNFLATSYGSLPDGLNVSAFAPKESE